MKIDITTSNPFLLFLFFAFISVSIVISTSIQSLRGAERSLVNSHFPLHHRSHNFSTAADEEAFYLLTKATKSDKIIAHHYSDMYGQFLLPYIRKKRRFEPEKPIKFLEIGFGCTMHYGAGESVKIWKRLFTERDSIWEAEFNEECVKKWKDDESLTRINFLIGDQSNPNTLNEWIAKSGGNFDIVIDDAAHKQDAIYASFVKLWPEVIPGGIYFIEDLMNARDPQWRKKLGGNEVENSKVNMVDLIHAWTEQIVVPPNNSYNFTAKAVPPEMIIPKDIRMIACIEHACVIAKCFHSSFGSVSRCS